MFHSSFRCAAGNAPFHTNLIDCVTFFGEQRNAGRLAVCSFIIAVKTAANPRTNRE